jgi:hypothetical protein
MKAQFFLFVIAILLFSIFWELCKIKTLIKRALATPARTPRERQDNGAFAKAAN